MMRPGCHVVYTAEDDYGPIEVIDYPGQFRGLHFGTKVQQTGMYLDNPVVLIHRYAQAMLTPLCWDTPKHVLVLGMGAGALVKYLRHFFPDMAIDAVELRPVVTEVAQRFFDLPPSTERFCIYHEDVDRFLSRSHLPLYDLVLVDLFLTHGTQDIPTDIGRHYKRLRAQITENGCLCMNVIGQDPRQAPGLSELRHSFAPYVYALPVPPNNVILIAAKHRCPPDRTLMYVSSAEKSLGLPFGEFCASIARMD